MYIDSVKVKNFKCLRENELFFRKPDGETEGSGLNVFVGENNSGKSSLMEAIHFLRNKGKNVKTIGVDSEDESYVNVTFTGNIEDVVENFVQDNKKTTFTSRIYEEDGNKYFTVSRSLKTEEDIKKILFLNKEKNEFKNESGIDAPFQKFFQISNIWADTNPSSESKYGSNTVCGNLLADISERFKVEHKEQYEAFLKVFQETFNSDTSGLQADLNEVAKETQLVLNEQFGEAGLRFRFDNPEADILFKNIKIFVNDGEETEINEKGHGLQRAVIISLLQVYARRISQLKDEAGEIKVRPHFLFIDEPELGLHPQAQRKLFDALMTLSKTHQIFITTHSENFVSPRVIENIYKFNNLRTEVKIVSLDDNDDLVIKENRQFFLHHHKLFFTQKAVFVEGPDDFERYPLFLQSIGKKDIARDFQLMKGCGDYPVFKKFCEKFDIKQSVIFDVDVLAKNNTVHNTVFSTSVNNKITKLNKDTSHKNPSNLLDENLTPDEVNTKQEIVKELGRDNIFVLLNGAVEHYLDNQGNVIDEDVAKKKELEELFGFIESL